MTGSDSIKFGSMHKERAERERESVGDNQKRMEEKN